MLVLYLFVLFLLFICSLRGAVLLVLTPWSGFVLCCDQIRREFAIILSVISFSVFLWSYFYISSELHYKRFIILILSFLFSMFVVIFSGNLVSLFVGWDLLGFTSFFLVSFYGNRKRHAASLLTALVNRFGDCSFYILLGLLVAGHGASYSLASAALIIISLTKSAQVPFSSWLPAAIYAPTPVRALVHSSTLVTAGVFLLSRFSQLSSGFLLSVGVFTSLLGGLSASLESDTKKIIAYSTLSQLGIIIAGLGLGQRCLRLNHMLVHAVIKALFFVSLGVLIHIQYCSQELRSSAVSSPPTALIFFSISICSLGLIGFAFTSGYYTKDLILEAVYLGGWALLILLSFYVSLWLTVVYCTRIWASLVNIRASTVCFTIRIEASLLVKLPVFLLLVSILFQTMSFSTSRPVFYSVNALANKVFLLFVFSLGALAGSYLAVYGSTTRLPLSQLNYTSSLLSSLRGHFNKISCLEVSGLTALGIGTCQATMM